MSLIRACCTRASRLPVSTEGRQLSLCRHYGDAELIPGIALQVPPLDDYAAYLESELASAPLADKRARGYKGKAIDYAEESSLKARPEIEIQPNQYFNLDSGDDCEITGVKVATSYTGDPARRRLMIQLKKAALETAMSRNPTVSAALSVEGARIQRLLAEEGF